MKKRWIAQSILLAVVVLGYAHTSVKAEETVKPGAAQAAAATAGTPALEVPHWFFDFGGVTTGNDYRHAFVVRNKGTAALEIKDVQAGCGTEVAGYDKVILPGAEGKIVIKLHPAQFQKGKKSRSLVLTNDPRVPRFTVEVQGKEVQGKEAQEKSN
ncbi:MAG: DUF1573 domain-containing protein [Syntrophobacteraceae bacterium]|nr:DUF1573 domain-containing protein [Syntrophobacteraceae bacterium]